MTTLVVRRVGNSLGVVIPKEQAARLGLRPGDAIEVELRKPAGIEGTFGLLKGQLGDWEEELRRMDQEDAELERRRGY